MKIMLVVGARPNFMKAGPIIAAIREHNQSSAAKPGLKMVEDIRLVLVHTGQHYDEAMSESFFADLRLPRPDVNLGVGSGSHAAQTAEVMRRFEEVLLREKPEALVVVGDVNSTLACALVASKISFDTKGKRPLVAHVEAGLRSFDRSMPEEVNRILTDHVSDLLFVTEESGIENLLREGASQCNIHFVGNTMIDSLLASKERADESRILDSLGLNNRTNGHSGNSTNGYALLTLHRPSNVDDREIFVRILKGLSELSSLHPIVFPVHPRTRRRIAEFRMEDYLRGIHLVDPLGYLDFLCLMKNALLVVTDSGGIQEETTCLGVPCITVRENTERPVTVTGGSNVIAGTDEVRITQAARDQLQCRRKLSTPEKWDGLAAQRIVQILVDEIKNNLPAPQLDVQPEALLVPSATTSSDSQKLQ
jgi:UDP-N-acetylglucosamine 2-epimerase (non-hydrolysing)